MSERMLRELLDEATRDIPAEVLRPPLERIRKRGRLRRFAWPASISGGLTALVAASAGILLSPAAELQPEPLPAPSRVDTTWSHAYVSEGGKTLTIHVHRPRGRCQILRNPQATVLESEQLVLVSVTGEMTDGECGNAGGEGIVTVRLREPVGRRFLQDNANGHVRSGFSDGHLPVIPADRWTQLGDGNPVQWEWDEPPTWSRHYTRPGGPDISIRGFEKNTAPSPRPAIDRMRLGAREWSLHPTIDGSSYQLVLDDGRVTYRLTLGPTEGGRVTEAQFREIIGSFTWP